MEKKKKVEISELQKIKYEVYLKDRDYLVSQKHKVEEREVNLLILLSTGIFTLFFAFSNIISSFEFIIFIVFAQLFALCSLVSILFSLIYSKRAFDKEIVIRDIQYGNENYNEEIKIPENKYTKYLRGLLVLSRFFIVTAVIFGFIFYSLNIFTMGNDSKTFTQNSEPCIKTNEPAPRPMPIVKEDK